MLDYIIQVVFFQLIFIVFYDVFLSKETFFVKNRVYLLGSFVVSLLIPFMAGVLKQANVITQYKQVLPEVIITPSTLLLPKNTTVFTSYIDRVLVIGMVVFLVLFLIKLLNIIRLIHRNTQIKKKDYTLILLPNCTKAFSFFKYIFLGEAIKSQEKQNIIAHELVHCKQKHTLDLLFFELLKILMWFNPLVYVYQKRIALVHEFLSDTALSTKVEKKKYIHSLLSEVFQVENLSFTNQFYKKSLIKKRIMMMTKPKSPNKKQVKYLLLIPIVAMMLCYVACSDEKREENIPPQVTMQKKAKDELSFSDLDVVPTFSGCEKGDQQCFAASLQKFLVANLDVNSLVEKEEEGTVKRCYIRFKITKEGEIAEVQTRAPNEKVKEALTAVMLKMPEAIPGEKDGEKVAVYYTLPIALKI